MGSRNERESGRRAPSTRRAIAGAVVAITVAVAALVGAPPAQAGTLGLTITVKGAGTVQVVEGGSYTCGLTNGFNQNASSSCARTTYEATFEAWVWLRATPSDVPAGNWFFAGWTGCDTTRVANGQVECGVHSGAFTLDERFPLATFTDVEAPTVSLGALLPRYFTNNVPISFSTTDPTASFRCSIDSGSFSSCSPGTFTFGHGTHTFRVFAQDPTGRVSATASSNFAVDLVAPVTTFTGWPAALAASRSASFGFVADEPSTFSCSVDHAPFTPCSSPTTVSGLADGLHTFRVFANDGFRNGTAVARTWTVDATAPDTTIDGPSGLVNDPTPTFTFASVPSADLAASECMVDNGPWTACSGPGNSHTVSTLADGSHTVQVRVQDLAGNWDQSPASRTVLVDTVAPDTTMDGPSGLISDDTPTFAFAGVPVDDLAGADCAVDDGGWAACSGPGNTHTVAPLAQGTHTVQVRVRDLAGNWDQSPASRTVLVDTVAPDTAVTSGPTGATTDTTPTFGFGSGDDTATFECRIDAGPWAACSGPGTTHTAPKLGVGSHTFAVRAVDAAGNADTTAATRRFSVSPPNTTITRGPSGRITDRTPTFRFTSTVARSTFQCRVDAGPWRSCTSPRTLGTLGLGRHTFAVRARRDGLTDATPAIRRFTVARP